MSAVTGRNHRRNLRRTPLRRSALPPSTRPIKPVNSARREKRRKAYQAAIHSARFRKLRLERFALDGWRCTEVVAGQRCGYVDESRTGADLIAEHTTYARFGAELITDLRTRCRWCDKRGTPQERFNHRRTTA